MWEGYPKGHLTDHTQSPTSSRLPTDTEQSLPAHPGWRRYPKPQRVSRQTPAPGTRLGKESGHRAPADQSDTAVEWGWLLLLAPAPRGCRGHAEPPGEQPVAQSTSSTHPSLGHCHLCQQFLPRNDWQLPSGRVDCCRARDTSLI